MYYSRAGRGSGLCTASACICRPDAAQSIYLQCAPGRTSSQLTCTRSCGSSGYSPSILSSCCRAPRAPLAAAWSAASTAANILLQQVYGWAKHD